ncbi:hypothetical protein HAV15_009920 [Penicillium sp. str. |nr:hypothetical protein HAV15_009920 [Penicillium sp. str. \
MSRGKLQNEDVANTNILLQTTRARLTMNWAPFKACLGVSMSPMLLVSNHSLDTTIGIAPSAVNPPSTVPPGNLSASSQGLEPNSQLMQYTDWVGGQNQFQDMHSLHPSYMFNAHEVTNEYNLLGDFLSNSLLDDGAMFQNQDMQGIYTDSSFDEFDEWYGATERVGSSGTTSAASTKPSTARRLHSTTNLHGGQ